MTKEYAEKLALPYIGDAKTLCVTSDGAVYVDNDIAYMEQNAKERNLKIFVLKDVEQVAEVKEVKEATEVAEKPKSNKKK